MTTADYIVVGSGLTGSVIARQLADAGREVIVLERRSHLGGNVHDQEHKSGIRYHTYGPHYFRTNSKRLWDYVGRFASWYEWKAEVQTLLDGIHFPWPLHKGMICHRYGLETWGNGISPANFAQACTRLMPPECYLDFVKGYTEKQWGCPASDLAPELAARFEVRDDGYKYLSRHQYQGLPVESYSRFMKNLLLGIPVQTGVDYLANRDAYKARKCLIFTGPIDEYFGFKLGKLQYRGQKRDVVYMSNADRYQPVVQVNNPDPRVAYVRTIEWKHLRPTGMFQYPAEKGTLLTLETPYSPQDPNDYEYPMPDKKNQQLYQDYCHLPVDQPILFCGRLGEYKYLDMDQAIAAALMYSERLMR